MSKEERYLTNCVKSGYKDERYLINQVQDGNKEAMEELIKQNNGLIWSVVRKFNGRGYELEDLYQIGCIGFIKSIKRFKPQLKYRISTFAVPYISGEIKKFIRDDGIIKVSRKLKEHEFKLIVESINEEIYENGKEEKIARIIGKEDDPNKLIDKITVNDIVEKLALREKTIIRLRYFKEKTQSQVAAILGISQVQVSRIEKKILDDMKEMMI